MVFIADTDIAAKAHALGCPGKLQDRRDRAATLRQLTAAVCILILGLSGQPGPCLDEEPTCLDRE